MGIIIVVLVLGLFAFVFYASFTCYHLLIISSRPDAANWNLTNDNYIVCPVIDDDSVTFYVRNKQGKVIFEPKEGWRDWDFKSINIDGNNVIVVISGDTGASVYVEDDENAFVKLNDGMYPIE